MAVSDEYKARRQRAQEKLHEAVSEYTKEIKMATMAEDSYDPETDVDWNTYYVGNWVIVIHDQSFSSTPRDAYVIESFPFYQPTHVTKGMLEQGRDIAGR
mgnify:FL=1